MAEQIELPEADSTNQKNEEAEEVEGRHFMELDRAMMYEERRRVEEEFEPLPSYLLHEEEKSAVKSLPVSTLFISNLRTDITETGLANTFCKFGNILGLEIFQTASGKLKNINCAKVSFATKQEAADAIQNVDNKPPLHLNVAMERKQEARDAFIKRVEFGNEWMERHANFEKEKEKIVKDVIGRVMDDEGESGKKSISVDEANEKAEDLCAIEEENYQNVTAQTLNRVKEENEQSHLSEGGHKMTTEETDPLEASDKLKEKKIRSPLPEMVGSATDGSVERTCEGKVYIPSDQSSATASSSSSSAVFGYELIIPFLSPSPCLHCRQPGRMVCSRCHGWYCSIDCQVSHWPEHKDSCHPISEQGGIRLMGEAGRNRSEKHKDKEQGEASRSSGSKSAKQYSSSVSVERKRRELKKFSVKAKTNESSYNQSKSNEENKKENGEEEIRSFEQRTGVVYQSGQYGNLPQVDISVPKHGIAAYDATFETVEPIIQPTQMSGWTEILLPISKIESPYRFWVVPKFNQEMLAELGRDLEQHVATASDIVEAVEGGFRLVEVSGGWHRALILRVDDDSQMAWVRLLDLGRELSVKCNCLLRLPPHLAATPAMAVMVRLAGVRPLGGEIWTEADLDDFNYFLSNDADDSRMWVKPVGVFEGTMLVSMEDHEGNNVADVMVAFKKARKGTEGAGNALIPTQTNKNRSSCGEVEEIGHFRSEFGLKSNSEATGYIEEISTSRINKSVSSCEEAEQIDPFKSELKKNAICIGHNFPSDEVAKTVNNNTPPSEEAEVMCLVNQKSRQKSNWEITGHTEESRQHSNWEITGHTEDNPVSSRDEDDSISAKSNSPKLILEQLDVGNVYEFGRAEGHPLSEFGAMSHFDSSTFDYIYNDMQIEYSGGGQDFGPANTGDELVVYSTDKSTFYRAVVLDFPTVEHVEVLLTDVGDTEVVRSTDLRVMAGRAANLHKFPFLAVKFFSLNSLSPQAEEAMEKGEEGKVRVVVESVGEGEEGGAVVGVLDEANTVVARYKVHAWQYLHPVIGQLKPMEVKDIIPQTVSRHQAVFISQIEPVKIADGATVNLHNIGKFACFGIIQLTDSEHVLRALKQALKVCETLPRIDFPPEIGQILAVSQKASGRNLKRAEVVKIDRSERTAKVNCLDVPDTMVLPWANMTLIPDTAVSIPAQCRQMRLAGVPKIPRKTALQLLRPIAARLEQPLVIKYHHEDQEMPSIYLCESSGARINDIIITTLQQHDEPEIKESPNFGTFIPRVVRENYRKSAQVKEKEEASSSKAKIKEVLEYDPENLHSLPVGNDEEVFVLNMTEDKSELHVCRMDLLGQIKNLQENLQDIGSRIKDSASSVVVNHVYLGQSVDDMWYRVVVLKTKQNKCLAYFPDFGFKEKIQFEKIRVFHDEYYRYVKSVPFFASQCVVNKMEDENANVRGDIREKSTQRIRIKSRDEGIYLIDVLPLN